MKFYTRDFPAIGPGSSVVLPWRSTSRESDCCLQIRPSIDHPQTPYSWGCAEAVGSGYAYGKEQALVETVSLSRQSNLTFKLNQLEKKDMLLYCSNSGSKLFWLSIGTDASVLHTELNVPVYDWKISVNSPLKLENRLPCPAKFTLWQKSKEGNVFELQNGIILSRGAVHMYSADIQKPVYLTLHIQGGWVMEKVRLYPNYGCSSSSYP